VQAIILCGGLATRLGETAKTLPKILLEIAGKTVLEWQIQLLGDAGVTEVVLASGHLHDVLHERVGGVYAGMRVRYAREEKRLGTGGAVQNAMKQVDTSPFFVLNGDILLANFSLREMLAQFRKGMMGVLLSVHVPDIRPYGEIVSDSDGKIQAFREKQPIYRPGYVNGAIYLFDQSIANAFPKGQEVFSLERDVFPFVSNLYALQTDADWIDIGVPERLAYAREHFPRL
jgi:NDP-sugar pyrophosphorylase family protein